MRKFLLLIALIISGLGLNAQSVGDYTIIECDGYSLKFTVTKVSPAECSVTCSTKPTSSMAVTIPASVEIGGTNFNVTSIGSNAFKNCSNLTSIEIPSGVTSIGSYAFGGCSSLESVTFGENSQLTSIGSSAFSDCSSLETVTFGENSQLTSIENYAFYQCSSLSSIEIPSNVTSIGNYAFSSCSSLTSIEIPSGVTSIGYYAFSSCSSLTSIEIPSGVTSIGEEAFSGCDGLTSIKCHAVEVPETSPSAFNNCPENMTIQVPAGSVEAYQAASPWNNYSITALPPSINIGDAVTIDYSGYSLKFTVTNLSPAECSVICSTQPTSSMAVTIPASVMIGETNINVTSIGDRAFISCSSLNSIEIPNSVTSIGDFAFYQCEKLNSIEISSVVTFIGEYAFKNCSSIVSVTFGENSQLTSIGSCAFSYCSSLIGIEIPNRVTSIGQYAFEECSSLESVTFGENSQLTSIERSAFRSCKLTSIEIPSSVTSIGGGVFYDCDALANMTVEEGNTVYDSRYNCNAIVESSTNELIVGCKNTIIPNTVTYIGDNAFSGCEELTSIEIPSSVTSIERYAFGDCSNLTSIEIPSSVTSIGYGAFYGCSSLEIVTFGENSQLTSIGDLAFKSCKLTSIEIPGSVTSIGDLAFGDCSSLTSIEIPNSVTSIGEYAFRSCKLTSIEIPSSVTSIESSAFYDCSSLNNVYIYRITPATLGSSVFPSDVSNIYVPSTALSSYKTTTNWSSYSSKIKGMPTYTSAGWIAADGTPSYTPSPTDDVVLNEHLTLSSGTRTNDILTINTLSFTENGSLTIEEGGQLIANKVVGNVTVKKTIEGYSQQPTAKSQSSTQWYSISSPLKGNVTATSITNLIDATTPANYALYRYDEPRFTWENYKYLDNNFTTLDAGRGYLYANAEDVTLEFTGAVNTDDVEYILTADAPELTGFHLVGNPFTYNITFEHLSTESNILVQGYYLLDGDGGWAATPSTTGDIKHSQGILIKTTADGTLTISPKPTTSKGQEPTANSQQPMLSLNVTNSNYSDRAFVIFGEGVGLDKINHENKDIPMLYIPMSDADYAIAMIDDNVSEIPVGFESSSMGEFTISLRHENCEFEELYLLDKETGAKIDILEQDYTFMATSGDNADRFILVKSQGSQPEAQSNFAYINNGDVVIYDVEGNAHIDIYDVLGRRVYNTTGRDDVHIVSTDGYSAGVYVIRIMDENGLRTQKVIIE